MSIPSKIHAIDREKAKQDLENHALLIAEGYQNGTLVELQKVGWQMTWNYLLKALRTCCPGFSEIEYGIALNQAFGKVE
ncbi:hypothetical protein DSCO28_24170 [Desulfosarcina ovata subsp. sediminis]|uniref:Uncharacterized protein n=1 Tax=Desulfosarcina ovata subsp. sediminis TaxID=885957 RepID=A0A5K7ZLL7_9BACT|nr:hypothetical protein [Desulfosarcina ovata]BBO81851.1 hypothetical protein DSCO28_24170 [Desulfosarcina ovata subsp. sediminis]